MKRKIQMILTASLMFLFALFAVQSANADPPQKASIHRIAEKPVIKALTAKQLSSVAKEATVNFERTIRNVNYYCKGYNYMLTGNSNPTDGAILYDVHALWDNNDQNVHVLQNKILVEIDLKYRFLPPAWTLYIPLTDM